MFKLQDVFQRNFQKSIYTIEKWDKEHLKTLRDDLKSTMMYKKLMSVQCMKTF